MFAIIGPILLLLLLCSIQQGIDASSSSSALRLCEVQGTCIKCPDGHFSQFPCRSSIDCFYGEYCMLQRGFCCPGSDYERKRNENRTSVLCPDGSNWGKMCKRDADCLFRDELCADGKCCPSCRQRRLQALRELRNFGSSTGQEPPVEEFIPQCSDDGKHFRPMQCTGRSGECFCVDKFGKRRRQWRGEEGAKAVKEKPKSWLLLNCSSLRELDEANGGGEHLQPPSVALSRDRWSTADALLAQSKLPVGDEQQEEPLPPPHRRCPDPLREFRHCGSACPISCATRTMPRCPQEQCLRGCFCRLPYVILDAADPFGSRCVLPAECPLLPFTPELDQWKGGFFPANQQPSPTSPASPSSAPATTEKCRDPLKNFQSCGSACPVGCGGRMASMAAADCPGHCVPGCFCRVPYVLRDPRDSGSECILPQQCPPPAVSLYPPPAEAQQLCLPERNQSWTECFSRKCSRACGEWPPFCVPDDCQPGCECQSAAVIRDKGAPLWECILPEDCPRPTKKKAKDGAEEGEEGEKCEPQKEFLRCGSSCPLGCDRLDQPLRQCSPCASGCFCRNGFVFVNASDWRSSACVPLNECPEESGKKAAPKPGNGPSATTITAIQQQQNDHHVPPHCSANSLDHEGNVCQNDGDCGDASQRRCCAPNATAPARCTCRDPNAIWTDCGPLCPEFCAQTEPHLCPGPCRPGCFCPPGYVKRTKDAKADCVPVAQCAAVGEESLDSESISGGGDKEVCGEALALANLYTKEGERIGRLTVRPERPLGPGTNTRRIRLVGEFSALSHGPIGGTGLLLLLSLHQFSDTTINGCAGVGHSLQLRLLEDIGHGHMASAGAEEEEVEELRVVRRGDGTYGLDQRIEWPDPIGQGTNPLIGHSVVLQQSREEGGRVILGCAVLGIAPNC